MRDAKAGPTASIMHRRLRSDGNATRVGTKLRWRRVGRPVLGVVHGAERNDRFSRGAPATVASEVSDTEERLRSTYTGPVHLVQPLWPVLQPAFAVQPEPVRLDGLTGARPGKGLDPVRLVAKAGRETTRRLVSLHKPTGGPLCPKTA